MGHGLVRTTTSIVAVAAAASCAGHPASPRASQALFGPVIGNELIVGRVVAGSHAWLLTGGNAVVHVDLAAARHTRVVVNPVAEHEHLWGLASTGDGTFWTLVGRAVLAQMSEDGRLQRRIELAAPHVGVFGAGRELLYQVMNFQPPADALAAGPPGEAPRRAWSRMRTRALPFARTAVAALNLVSCGATASGTIPCWFPDQAAVTVTDAPGHSREFQLEGLPTLPAEVLLASDNPRRPIRDAFVSADNHIWILGSGEPPPAEAAPKPGAWVLARYDRDGRLLRRLQLREPARLLLNASDQRCVLLSWDGRVVEVRP
jgi:hypothetical protein